MELSAVDLTKRYGPKTAVNRLNATLTFIVAGSIFSRKVFAKHQVS